MKITLLVAGTRGDVQPAVALGVGLVNAGYDVLLVTHQEFHGLVAAHGINFMPINVDMPALYARYGNPEMFENGAMAVRFIPEIIKVFQVMWEEMARDFLEASQGADAIIGVPASNALATSIAVKMKIPYIDAYVQPLAPTRAFPTIFWPKASSPCDGRGFRGAYNLFTYKLVQQVSWLGVRPLLNRSRTTMLGMPPLPLFGGSPGSSLQENITLAGYSESVIRRPPDWPANIHVTGYWFLQTPDYQPPPELQEFLQAGPPPVYIGFGSMPSKDPQKTAALAAEALRLSNQRGILFTGKGVIGQGMAKHAESNDIFFLESASHDWLFPRVVAVVHHGGSGTTAAGLRAGVPSILVPSGTDQLLWAQRVDELGLGPRPIPRSRLTPERLAAAISLAVSDPGIREQACLMGEKLRAEDGVGNAVRVLDHYFRA